jgi:ATP-dependent Clp protease protease subunit
MDGTMTPKERLLEAGIDKLEAETREIRDRTARTASLMAGHEKLAAVRLQKALAEAEVYEIELAKARRDEKTQLSDWKFSQTLNFVGSVDKSSAQAAIDKLHMWSVTFPGAALTIVFNSPGGSVIDGMALFDYIRFLRDEGHRVTIIALGYAASMAGILLQAGDVRVMAKGSWLLIHEVAFSTSGKIGEIEDMYKFGERLKKQAADIFIERSGGKLTAAVLEANWTRKDWWLSPDEALALGLIDEVR